MVKAFENLHLTPNRCLVPLDLLFGDYFERYVLVHPRMFAVLGTFGSDRQIRVLAGARGDRR